MRSLVSTVDCLFTSRNITTFLLSLYLAHIRVINVQAAIKSWELLDSPIILTRAGWKLYWHAKEASKSPCYSLTRQSVLTTYRNKLSLLISFKGVSTAFNRSSTFEIVLIPETIKDSGGKIRPPFLSGIATKQLWMKNTISCLKSISLGKASKRWESLVRTPSAKTLSRMS